MKTLLVFLLKFYKSVISPMMPSACRFEPTCSVYTKIALEKYGVRKGLILGIKRILRCHPFSTGGFDPVP